MNRDNHRRALRQVASARSSAQRAARSPRRARLRTRFARRDAGLLAHGVRATAVFLVTCSAVLGTTALGFLIDRGRAGVYIGPCVLVLCLVGAGVLAARHPRLPGAPLVFASCTKIAGLLTLLLPEVLLLRLMPEHPAVAAVLGLATGAGIIALVVLVANRLPEPELPEQVDQGDLLGAWSGNLGHDPGADLRGHHG